MRSFAAALLLSASLSPAEGLERISVRAPRDLLHRLAGLSEAIARWHPDLDVAWVPDEAGAAFAALFDGSADLIVSSRGIGPRERALSAKLSLEIHEHIAGLDAVSVIVHPDNGVASLSFEQVQMLFSGKVVGWYGFGGSDLPIRLLVPVPSSGEYQALRQISPGADFKLPPSAELVSTSDAVVSTVASDPRAVGLVPMSLRSLRVRAVPLSPEPGDAPIVASADSVERGQYPLSLTRTLWLYSRGSAGDGLQRLLSCLLSSRGQEEIEKAGLVALSADRAFQRTLPARERSRGGTVTRVSFRTGLDGLDRQAREVLTGLARGAAEVWITGHAELLEDRSEARNLSERRARAVEEFLTALGVAVAEARYPKYYEQNPLGPPLLFFAQELASRQVVGMAALFPVELWIEGEAVLGGVPGDFAVDRAHRGLGPALALQRALLEALPSNGLHFAYGNPNRFSDPVTERVGYADVGQMTRFVKILKAGVLARTAVRRPALARLVSTLAPYTVDPMLSVLSGERLYRRRAHVRVEHAERFDERFLGVFDEMSRQHRITPQRTPELLNWKYEKGIEGERARTYSILALTEHDAKVLGYVVYKTSDRVRFVQDIGFMPSRSVVDALLSEFILDARRQEIDAISLIHLGPESLLTRRLRSFGFVRRTVRSRLRVFVPDAASLAADLRDKNNWFFLDGDTDI